MGEVPGNDELQRLAGACQFLSRALSALILALGATALFLVATWLGGATLATADAMRAALGILGLPAFAVLAGLARTAAILWGGGVAAGIVACSIPMPLVAPVALVYAILVSRRRLNDAGFTPSVCSLLGR